MRVKRVYQKRRRTIIQEKGKLKDHNYKLPCNIPYNDTLQFNYTVCGCHLPRRPVSFLRTRQNCVFQIPSLLQTEGEHSVIVLINE